jgi:hypothetical protein
LWAFSQWVTRLVLRALLSSVSGWDVAELRQPSTSVKYRLGGRESAHRYAGSFSTKREALAPLRLARLDSNRGPATRRGVGDLQVVLPVARRSGELPRPSKVSCPSLAEKRCAKPGSIASDEPYAAVERDAIRPAYAA